MDSYGKTTRAVAIDYGTESKVLGFGEWVYRGMQSLCARGAGSGERSC